LHTRLTAATEADLVEMLVSDPESASDVFGRIKVRGMAQAIFRKVLVQVYEGRCAFCGLTFEDALEASHLIPLGEASAQERLDPRPLTGMPVETRRGLGILLRGPGIATRRVSRVGTAYPNEGASSSTRLNAAFRSRHVLCVVTDQFLKIILQNGAKILAIGQHSRLTNIPVIL
jgi:hypothetical protein